MINRVLKERRLALKLSQKELGEAVGVSQQHMNRYENGYPIPYDKIEKIAAVLDVDKNLLLPDSFQNEIPDISQLKNTLFRPGNVKINILDVKACCGTGIENLTEQVTGCWQMPLVEFKKISFADPRNVYMIQASGDSMLPTIADGDWALVDLAQNFMSSDGIYLIKLANGLAIKRLQAGLKNLTVKSDNPQYGDITAESGELTVVGKIIYILNAKKV